MHYGWPMFRAKLVKALNLEEGLPGGGCNHRILLLTKKWHWLCGGRREKIPQPLSPTVRLRVTLPSCLPLAKPGQWEANQKGRWWGNVVPKGQPCSVQREQRSKSRRIGRGKILLAIFISSLQTPEIHWLIWTWLRSERSMSRMEQKMVTPP